MYVRISLTQSSDFFHFLREMQSHSAGVTIRKPANKAKSP